MLSTFIEFLLSLLLNRTPRRGKRTLERSVPAASAAGAVGDQVLLGAVVPSVRDRLLRRDTGSAETEIRQSLEERKRHVYVVGRTGSGKTVLLTNYLLHDVRAGRGVALLDMRGDLADKVLQHLADLLPPDELAERLILLDLREHAPFQTPDEPVVGFDPLSQCGADPYSAAAFTLDLLRQQWGDAGLGTQMQETLRYSFTALALAGGTLLDLEPLLTDAAFRDALLAKITDGETLRFFARFAAMAPAVQAQWTLPCLNKISVYTGRPGLRLVLGQRTGTLALRDVLEARPDAIFLGVFAADELFRQTAGLLGNLVTAALTRAVMRSDRTVYGRSQTLHLVLDEFTHLASAAPELLAEILGEGRRFGLHLTAAHQSTVQLEPKMRLLLRNIPATMVAFSVGGADADTLAGELPLEEPKSVTRTLLQGLPVGEALVVRQGKPVTRVRLQYIPTPVVPEAKVTALRRAALERWGRPRADVQAELASSDASLAAAVTPSCKIAPESARPGERSAASVPASTPAPTPATPTSGSDRTGLSGSSGDFEVRDLDDGKPSRRRSGMR